MARKKKGNFTVVLLILIFAAIAYSQLNLDDEIEEIVETIETAEEEKEQEPEPEPEYSAIDSNADYNILFCPEDDCEMELYSFLNEAEESIDCALYDINLASLKNLLERKSKEIALRQAQGLAGVRRQNISDCGFGIANLKVRSQNSESRIQEKKHISN